MYIESDIHIVCCIEQHNGVSKHYFIMNNENMNTIVKPYTVEYGFIRTYMYELNLNRPE